MGFPRHAVLRLQLKLPTTGTRSSVHQDRCLVLCAQRCNPRAESHAARTWPLFERSIFFPPRRILHSHIFWNSCISGVRTLSSSPPPNNTKKETEQDKRRKFARHWWHQLKSPPNMITTARILSTPFLSHLIITENYEWALCGCLVAGLSDILDGHLAKHYNMTTVLGSYLDPLADKLLINVVSLSLWHVDILPTPLILLWLSRDVGLMVSTYLLVRSHTVSGNIVVDPVTTPFQVKPTAISKLNTCLQFVTLFLAMLQPLPCTVVPPGVLEGSCYITGITTICSGYSYIGGGSLTASGNHHDSQNKNNNTIQSSSEEEIATLKRQAKVSSGGTAVRDKIQTKMANLSSTKARNVGGGAVGPKRKR